MKRGASGLSLVVGVDKPIHMTSHDVVDRCRNIFNERRVGHMGTLDPLAGGVLPVCIGPATRMNNFISAQDKCYVVKIIFGFGTDTDDAEGKITEIGDIPDEVYDPFFAQSFIESLIGVGEQLPPAYSAIKINGKKACDEARKGHDVSLQPRQIEVYDAKLLKISGDDRIDETYWRVYFHVSKGTYIRALARDIGNTLGCYAYVGELRRTRFATLEIDDCVSLDTLEDIGVRAAVDPVALLGLRFAYIGSATAFAVKYGSRIPADKISLFEFDENVCKQGFSSCKSGVHGSCIPPYDSEPISLIANNKLVAIYEFDNESQSYESRCNFSIGVSRGYCI